MSLPPAALPLHAIRHVLLGVGQGGGTSRSGNGVKSGTASVTASDECFRVLEFDNLNVCLAHVVVLVIMCAWSVEVVSHHCALQIACGLMHIVLLATPGPHMFRTQISMYMFDCFREK